MITTPSITPTPYSPVLRGSSAPPSPSPILRVRLAAAGPALWRVVDAAGRIIGHLQQIEHPLGTRWGARRYDGRNAALRTIGDFWSVDDAVTALRSG